MSLNITTTLPPLDGSLTLPEVAHYNLLHNPTQPFFIFSDDEHPNEIVTISHLEFARASCRAARAVLPGSGPGDVVAIIALIDNIAYHAIIVGLMHAGLVPFPISSRNSPAAIVHLLRKTSSHRILTTPGTLNTLMDGITAELAAGEAEYPVHIDTVPDLQQLYPKLGMESADDSFDAYITGPRPALHDIAMYMHSSGSTGFPKPIPETHEALIEWAAIRTIRSLPSAHSLRLSGMGLPPFHSMGFVIQLLCPLFGLTCAATFPPVVNTPTAQPHPPSSNYVLEHLKRTHSNAMLIVPALLQGLGAEKEGVEVMKDFVFVGYGGGPLPHQLGDSLAAAGVNIQALYGTTEIGGTAVIRMELDPMEWDLMQFSERTKMRWVLQDDGTYEAQYLTCDSHHPSVENIKDTRGYATSDLFVQHPTKKNLWRIVSRIDDVIIHSSGEKTVPAPMEDIMNSSPLIRGVVMFGREHDQSGVLIEPVQELQIDVRNQQEVSELRNRLWPVVEQANEAAPAFSRIFKEMVLITSREKPLPRSSKGMVMRKASLRMYEEEIEALYSTIESHTSGGDGKAPVSWDVEAVRTWLLEQAQEISSNKQLSPSNDLFDQGFDSLSATFLRLRIVGALRTSDASSPVVSQNVVYNYPTIDQLSTYIIDLMQKPESSSHVNNKAELIEKMIAKYSVGLDEPLAILPDDCRPLDRNPRRTVLVTGTTGNLGSHLLALLLRDESVERVYALNRPASHATALARHEARFTDKGLDLDLLRLEKVAFLEGDASQDRLGLDSSVYDEVRASVNLIIHIAWRLDFNLTLSSFEANILGTRNLIDMARSGPHALTVRFLYTSSIGSAQSWDHHNGPYPEEVVYDANTAVGGGYGESKYVTERILAKSGLCATSIRLGQITGGMPNGSWATSDWLPILVKSSLAMGALPVAGGVISWLPMDAAAQVILDVGYSMDSPPVALNLVHPKPVSWKWIITEIKRAMASSISLTAGAIPFIPFREWFANLENHARNASQEDLKHIPAIKLLDFFRNMAKAEDDILKEGRIDSESGGLAILRTNKMQSISSTLEELLPICAEDAQRWVAYWKSVGFF
ncbi:acetyl-CoA synthetase-like protein [Crucibulum laeve]|uniref:Acetyl-CoA synthetase-like protein n=1 Tax=Crucibulum laeve TaxID=68775 RepID=A0A5C3LM91_9AGAR|nr:acetyl-CoA synthetase-like protein [Crucibulum laeve]